MILRTIFDNVFFPTYGVLAAVMAALVDYSFKSAAAARLTSGEELVVFFGQFYAAVGMLTFLIQSALGPRLLKRYGIGITLAAYYWFSPVIRVVDQFSGKTSPDDLEALVDRCNLLIAAGTVRASTRSRLLAHLKKIEDPAERARLAVFGTAASAEGAILR